MMVRRLILGSPILLSVALNCCAQGGPPMQTDDPGTPGNGNWELNVGITIERRMGVQALETPSLDLNYGVGDRLQLKIAVPWVQQADVRTATSGLGNSVGGVKWRFYENDRLRLQISTYPQVEFNNPTRSVARGLVDAGTRVLVPIEVAKAAGPINLNAEVGYSVRHVSRTWIAGLAIGRQVTRRLELLGEVHHVHAASDTEREKTFGLGGRLKVHPNVIVLLMAGRSLPGSSSNEPQFIAYGGLRFIIPRHRE